MERFLREHIDYAWIDMMRNHNEILDGITDLSARKGFVSSLQNVIELIFKQYMLDRNDHKVLSWNPSKVKKFWQKVLNKKIETRGRKQIAFESINDLNTYFVNNPSKANAKTIGFSNLIDIIDNMIKQRNPQFDKSNLNLLRNLRNNETHFYIDDAYLTFAEFKNLGVLIKDVYDFIERDMFLGFFGNPGNGSKESLKYFDNSTLTARSSYKDLVISADTNIEILSHLEDYNDPDSNGLRVDYAGNDNIFSISCKLFAMSEREDAFDIPVKITQYELYRRLSLLKKFDKIYITDDRKEYEDGYTEPKPAHSIIYKK